MVLTSYRDKKIVQTGIDDDLPPSHQNIKSRGGRIVGNGRSIAGSETYPRIMEKESLITELRKELRLSNEEHRELLARVNADNTIRRIREWRQACVHQPGVLGTGQAVHDSMPSPTVSASHKKQKLAQSVQSQSLGGPSPVFHAQAVAVSHQPSPLAAKRGYITGSKGKKQKPGIPGVSSKSITFPPSGPSGRGQVNLLSAGAAPEGTFFDPLIGRKVKTRWPDDNNFYEAVITDYNPVEGWHALVYDMHTQKETWEWVNLSEISPEDIQWVGEDPGISRRGHGGRDQVVG
ncbi:hypothetical protein HS088_TW13G01257 [Tripterygium wilfordii]|uniref:ENT domain-containing protein n=1 Tax=Tripterygium wilfordii TaxID=458696 RepID=A0A7J7CWP4_TRIWF|nr:hypothetical protein HS088_TW13G01257 [Tripterygium wilfordii]